MKRISPFILAMVLIGLASSQAQASYFARCNLIAKVVKTQPKCKRKTRKSPFRCQVNLKIKAIGKQSGHSKSHCTSKGFRGKTFAVTVFVGSPKDLKKFKKNTIVWIKYSTRNSLTPRGSFHRSTWQLHRACGKKRCRRSKAWGAFMGYLKKTPTRYGNRKPNHP